ncbi:metallophosphoesterase family protein [Algoriphagus sp. PAP.12]|uniref:metallophosphoesterase family protein n=1 Tax=Algoriphagus sp. PAP.12 TaxID=2996678 RepID=UPI00227B6B10|nr:metallophosphoesterase [Algoriphagus sp. PAP.12]
MNSHFKKSFFAACFFIFSLSNISSLCAQQSLRPKVAFVSDIHLQNVYGDFGKDSFEGIPMENGQPNATIRSMRAQINSTRLFNENYFALIQTLKNLAEQQIKLVVLPGDYTDDGQPMNVRKLAEILNSYSNRYGMRFFITTGNHDPVLPFGGKAGKRDFLDVDGSEVGITGDSLQLGKGYTFYSDSLNYWGYPNIMATLKSHGFFPHPEDIFWTHPFEEIDYEAYSFKKAESNSKLEFRQFVDDKSGFKLPDASYVVEPVEGLWLLAIDGNVYQQTGSENQSPSENWKGSSVGFNQATQLKKHQLDWIKKVRTEADKRGKLLISFSHYPLADFNNGSTPEMKKLFGENKMQLARVPLPPISQAYADAGIEIHFAGHMHQNDTEIFKGENGKKLVNIQVPSLAAFPPAYKTMSWNNPDRLLIQTQTLKQIEEFHSFFDLYKREHEFLAKNEASKLWDSQILSVNDYWSFTHSHLEELTKTRFLKEDFPKDLAELLQNSSLIELAELLELEGLPISKLEGADQPGLVIQDFYQIKNAGDFGKQLVGKDRLDFYQNLNLPESGKKKELIQFFKILKQLSNDLPSSDFWIKIPELEVIEF